MADRSQVSLDSESLSIGMGFLAWTAAQAAAEGRSMDEIVALFEGQDQRIHVSAALDTVEFLKRSGWMNRAMAALGSWPQMKPLLRMHVSVLEPSALRGYLTCQTQA